MQLTRQQLRKQKRDNHTEQQPVATVYCQPTTPLSWLQVIATAFSLCTLTAITYLSSLHYPFQFDDLASISYHFNIRHTQLADLFMANRRWISYWLNSLYYAWDRFNPFIYRIGNLTFHLTTGLLVFTIFFTAFRRSRQQFFAQNALTLSTIIAALFLLHPVQSQTVSYVIQGQLEGLATLATVLMVALFMWYTTTQNTAMRVGICIALCAVAAVGSCTKEIFVVTPLLIVLFDWFFITQGNWSALKQRVFLHALVGIIIVGMFVYFADLGFFSKLWNFSYTAQNGAGSLVTQDYTNDITTWPYIMSQFKVILHYLWIFMWPFGMCVDYDCTLASSFFSGDVMVPLLLLVAGGLFLLHRFLRNPIDPVVFGFLWFFIYATPRSVVPSAELMNDYKTYGASIGMFFLLACGIVWVINMILNRSYGSIHSSTLKLRRTLTTSASSESARPECRPQGGVSKETSAQNHSSVLLLLIIPLAFCTYQRNKVWSSEKEFWWDIIQKAPGKVRAYNYYGTILAKEGDHQQAIHYFKKAIALDPQYVPPYNNMAITYNMLNDKEEALKIMQTLTKLQPNNPEIQSNCGSFLLEMKNFDEAEKYIKRAIELRPHYGKAYFHLGRLYFEKGDQQAAYEAFKKACTQADFDTVQGFYAYGKSCLITNRYEEAAQAYQKAYAVAPNGYEICFEYASVQCMRSNFKEAQELYKRAYALKQDDANLLFNLGESYWADQQYHEALAWFKKAEERHVQNPALAIRLAGCYEKTGNRAQARAILEEFLKQNPPVDLKKAAQGALTKLRD